MIIDRWRDALHFLFCSGKGFSSRNMIFRKLGQSLRYLKKDTNKEKEEAFISNISNQQVHKQETKRINFFFLINFLFFLFHFSFNLTFPSVSPSRLIFIWIFCYSFLSLLLSFSILLIIKWFSKGKSKERLRESIENLQKIQENEGEGGSWS